MRRFLCSSLVLSAAVVWCGISSGVSAQQPLPDAGQELCTDETGALVPCVNTSICPGQDGFYATGCQLTGRFDVDNGGDDDVGNTPVDDVVKDNCTGLMWTRAMSDFSGDGFIDLWSFDDDETDWETALDYCENLTYAGFDDWRMPNVREILTLVNFDVDPAGLAPFSGYWWIGGHWTSTSRVDVVGPNSRVFIFSGREGKTSFAGVKTGITGIRPVRTMLPGDPAAGGGGAGSDGGERGGGAGPVCATENGDDNGDGGRDLSDAIYKLSFLFQGGGATVPFCTPAGAKAEGCAAENGDDNGDGGRDLSDAIYKLAFLFQGGPDPVAACPNIGGPETSCNDNVDNDIDGDTDCDDDDCEGTSSCVETICDDFFDNDGDGDADCDDDDCIGQAGCPGPEICSNNLDDDEDGSTDCTDQDCAGSLDCQVEGGTGLPDTGQRTCYSTDAEINPCPAPGEPFYGQDGSHDTGCGALNRFTDNGNGTVTDGCTGLMWQQVDDGVDRLWCEALAHCEDLDLGGETDWRMPNVFELESLVHYGFRNPPMIDPIFEDTNGSPGRYWTSTTRWDSTAFRTVAWLVEFNEGTVDPAGDKDGDLWPVRAVRGQVNP